jgi:hypothetical protein
MGRDSGFRFQGREMRTGERQSRNIRDPLASSLAARRSISPRGMATISAARCSTSSARCGPLSQNRPGEIAPDTLWKQLGLMQLEIPSSACMPSCTVGIPHGPSMHHHATCLALHRSDRPQPSRPQQRRMAVFASAAAPVPEQAGPSRRQLLQASPMLLSAMVQLLGAGQARAAPIQDTGLRTDIPAVEVGRSLCRLFMHGQEASVSNASPFALCCACPAGGPCLPAD